MFERAGFCCEFIFSVFSTGFWSFVDTQKIRGAKSGIAAGKNKREFDFLLTRQCGGVYSAGDLESPAE